MIFFYYTMYLNLHNNYKVYSIIKLIKINSFYLLIFYLIFNLLMFWRDILLINIFYEWQSIHFFIIFYEFEEDLVNEVILMLVFFLIIIQSLLFIHRYLNLYFEVRIHLLFYDVVVKQIHLDVLIQSNIVIKYVINYLFAPFLSLLSIFIL